MLLDHSEMVSYVAETHCWQRKQKRIRISLVSQEKRQMVWSAEDAYARGQNVTLAGVTLFIIFIVVIVILVILRPHGCYIRFSIISYSRALSKHIRRWSECNDVISLCGPHRIYQPNAFSSARLWVELLDTLDRTWFVIETFSWYFSVGPRTSCSIMVLFLFTTLGTVSSFHFIKSTWISPNPLIDRISNQMHWIVY